MADWLSKRRKVHRGVIGVLSRCKAATDEERDQFRYVRNVVMIEGWVLDKLEQELG